MHTALTIAGSDSVAGAGIQADLKTFAALGVYGLSAVTAVTAQNTLGVRAIHAVPPEMVAAQIDALAEDLRIDAIKLGMLTNIGIVHAVAAAIDRWSFINVVLDPVILATSGDTLLPPDAVAVMRSALIPRATVVTPNAAEAALLADMPVATSCDARTAAERILALGARCVIIKGGHLADEAAIDVLVDRSGCQELSAPRGETASTHGSGCAFAAAIAAHLALGRSIRESAEQAKTYIATALRHRLPIGHGQPLLDHFRGTRKVIAVNRCTTAPKVPADRLSQLPTIKGSLPTANYK